jgi:heterodisulfide reductase subunit B
MSYLYYPGCSLTGTAREYDLATRAVMDAMGIPLMELEEWTCCGASAAEACSDLLALALPAINLAIAENMDAQQDIMVPCSACYLNLKKAAETMRQEPLTRERVNTVLAENDLAVKGTMKVRHLLDVLATDLGAAAILQGARGADAIVTVCPMCQMNLEAYQDKIAKRYGHASDVTILYLPQLIGMALGLSDEVLGLPLNLALSDHFRNKCKSAVNA